jgi:hypothetical protein
MSALLGRIRLHAVVANETNLDAFKEVVAIGPPKFKHLAWAHDDARQLLPNVECVKGRRTVMIARLQERRDADQDRIRHAAKIKCHDPQFGSIRLGVEIRLQRT